MKIKSAKAKGRNLQNLVRDKLRSIFVGKVLEEDDIKSQTMGMSGEDIVLTPAAKKQIPYSFECKNNFFFSDFIFLFWVSLRYSNIRTNS